MHFLLPGRASLLPMDMPGIQGLNTSSLPRLTKCEENSLNVPQASKNGTQQSLRAIKRAHFPPFFPFPYLFINSPRRWS